MAEYVYCLPQKGVFQTRMNAIKLPTRIHVGLHILGWFLNGANLILPAFFMPMPPGIDAPRDGHILGVLVIGITHLVMQMIVFYANFFWVFDKYFMSKNRTYYFFVSVVFILTIWFIENEVFQYDLLHLRPPMPFDMPPPERPYPDFLLPLVTAYFASFLVKLYPLFVAQQVTQVQLQSQKQAIQLNLLKGQMQPHFLFNTLNNLRYLVRTDTDKADHAIIQLSELLQYTVYASEKEKVSLQEETDYLNNFIDLQRMRLPKDVQVNVKMKVQHPDTLIAPLLLIPFVENAFKYGVSAQYPGFIIIELTETDHQFYFTVNNRNYRQKVKGSTGIGISNVKERLNYLYPHRHHLDIINNDNDFTVKLSIDLTYPLCG